MAGKIALTASQEDYLEAIQHIVTEKMVARSKDLVARLGVNSSSVTQALRALSQKGLINYERYGVVTLTDTGEELALDVIRRHEALRDFFVQVLGVDPGISEDAACRMEHAMPRQILDRLVYFIEFTKRCPYGSADWVEGFGYRCQSGPADDSRCEQCEFSDMKPSSE